MKKIGFFIIFLIFLTGACSMTAMEVRKGENHKEKPDVRESNLLPGELYGEFEGDDGELMAGGMVFFFNEALGPPPTEFIFRIPDHVDDIDSEGRFSVMLPEGKYYIGAIKRVSEKVMIGPPQEGDFWFANMDEDGKPRVYFVRSGERLDAGSLSDIDRFPTLSIEQADAITGIAGLIIDSDGNPVEGALVFAYMDIANVVGKPLYVSGRSDQDGIYVLRVFEGGEYYLRVRDIYGGGPPELGEIMGGYGNEEPLAVTVNTGEITSGIDINVIKFPGRGPKAGRIGSSNIRPQMQDKTDGSNETMDK